MKNANNIKEGFTFWTGVNTILFIYQKFKNGVMLAYEFGNGVEKVEYEYDEDDILMGKQSFCVYVIVDKSGKIIKDKMLFYFDRKSAKADVKKMNASADKQKPYRVKKMYLLDYSKYGE